MTELLSEAERQTLDEPLRIADRTAEISSPAPSGDRQTEADRFRLRALGYLV